MTNFKFRQLANRWFYMLQQVFCVSYADRMSARYDFELVKMATRMLFHFCWQVAALLWYQLDGSLAQSTGKDNALDLVKEVTTDRVCSTVDGIASYA